MTKHAGSVCYFGLPERHSPLTLHVGSEVKLTKTYLTGQNYLKAITRFLQECRNEDPNAGLYEAADLQWWWREDNCSTLERQVFWINEAEEVIAVLLLYDDEDEWNVDFLRRPSCEGASLECIFGEVLEVLQQLPYCLTFTVRDDDAFLIGVLEESGWRQTEYTIVQTLLKDETGVPRGLPEDFCFEVRSGSSSKPHPMTTNDRNPRDVEERLSECSLYRSDLDYSIVHVSGETAGYALFWMDPATKVGLIEPMRIEDSYQGRGLGTVLVQQGIRCLRAEGAKEIKVSYEENNEAARNLYHRCGFRDVFRKLQYRREPSQQDGALNRMG